MEKQLNTQEKDKRQKRVLITGSKGIIGNVLSQSLAQDFEVIQLDIKANPIITNELKADISSQESLDAAFQNIGKVDYIIHLAGNASHETPWEEVLRNNIIGTRNVYESARKYGVKKIIFASSTHLTAYEGYPQKSPLGRTISPLDPPRPDSDYGISKGFGEILARKYYDLYGIKTICIRIGSVTKDDKPVKPYEKLWLSHRDLSDIFKKALDSNIPFGIYFATSDNLDQIFDINPTKRDLGFDPKGK